MIVTIFHEILCYGGIVMLPYSYQYAGWTGVLLHTLAMTGSSIVLDFVLSPTAGKNVGRIADAYKVSRFAVYALMAVNVVSANVLVVSILLFCDAMGHPPLLSLDPAAVLRLIGILAVYWTISEVTFTAGHIWLHRTKIGARIHFLHHLCRQTSWSTNVLFHPLDLAVEFGGPFFSMILVHRFFIGDPLALKAALVLLYIWYAADHSENLGLSHSIHHSFKGSRVLTIYGRYEWFERLMGDKKGGKDDVYLVQLTKGK